MYIYIDTDIHTNTVHTYVYIGDVQTEAQIIRAHAARFETAYQSVKIAGNVLLR